jgi:hypothetical protein
MIGGRHMDEVGLLAAIVPLRQRPSRLIACCRKWAALAARHIKRRGKFR